jgi:hypothetical protein
VDELRRRRSKDDAFDPALAVAADDHERVLLALDLADQLVPRCAASDPALGGCEPFALCARLRNHPLRLGALPLLVVVGRHRRTGAADERSRDVVRGEQHQPAFGQHRRLPGRHKRLGRAVDPDEHAAEDGRSFA